LNDGSRSFGTSHREEFYRFLVPVERKPSPPCARRPGGLLQYRRFQRRRHSQPPRCRSVLGENRAIEDTPAKFQPPLSEPGAKVGIGSAGVDRPYTRAMVDAHYPGKLGLKIETERGGHYESGRANGGLVRRHFRLYGRGDG